MTDDDKQIVSFQLDSGELSHIAGKNAASRTEGLRQVIEGSRKYDAIRAGKIAEITKVKDDWEVSAEELGFDLGSGREADVIEVLTRFKQVLKRNGKAALVEEVKEECRKHGLENRGGSNKGVQNPETENRDTEINEPIPEGV
jgi:predicted Zn-ribbon and HTH transcriptional regulator